MFTVVVLGSFGIGQFCGLIRCSCFDSIDGFMAVDLTVLVLLFFEFLETMTRVGVYVESNWDC